MDTSDHELMNRCGQGDATAFEVLVRRWEGRIERVLQRLVSSPSDAEDLKQGTFVRVLLASKRYKANGAFSTWLYRIAINLARDAARRRKPVAPLGEIDVPGNGHTPDLVSQQKERHELIEDALGSLPEELREVLVLRHYSDLTFARIGDVLNQPESTIKSRTRSALKKLYGELRQRGLTNGELE